MMKYFLRAGNSRTAPSVGVLLSRRISNRPTLGIVLSSLAYLYILIVLYFSYSFWYYSGIKDELEKMANGRA